MERVKQGPQPKNAARGPQFVLEGHRGGRGAAACRSSLLHPDKPSSDCSLVLKKKTTARLWPWFESLRRVQLAVCQIPRKSIDALGGAHAIASAQCHVATHSQGKLVALFHDHESACSLLCVVAFEIGQWPAMGYGSSPEKHSLPETRPAACFSRG